MGKLTCLLLHGSGKPQYFEAEYMYFVDNKQYFVTYKMAYEVPKDQQTDKMNADMVLLGLKDALILFYATRRINPPRSRYRDEPKTTLAACFLTVLLLLAGSNPVCPKFSYIFPELRFIRTLRLAR